MKKQRILPSENKNALFLLTEKILRLLVNVGVSIVVIRKLGPERYGIVSFILAVAFLLQPVVMLGLDKIIIREIIRRKEDANGIIGTAICLKTFAALFALIGAYIAIKYTNGAYVTYVWLLGFYFFLLPIGTFDHYMQAQYKVKPQVYSRILSTIILSLAKMVACYLSADIGIFVLIYSVESGIGNLFIYAYIRKQPQIKIKFNYSESLFLLRKGSVLMLSSIMYIVYFKIDQLMISKMLSPADLGYYAVAANLSEKWYFIPQALIAANFPFLLKREKDNEINSNDTLQSISDKLFIIGIFFAVIFTIFSEQIVMLLYGDVYKPAAIILSIHGWCGILMSQRMIVGNYLTIHNAERVVLLTNVFGATTNVILNLYLIPKMGGVGAAVASLISYFVASKLILFLYKPLRPLLKSTIYAYVFPMAIKRIVKERMIRR